MTGSRQEPSAPGRAWLKATASDRSSITQVLGDQHVHLPLSATQTAAVMRTLPRDVAAFTGRDAELERLLAAAEQQQVVTIHAVEGMPGIGKTALVTHAAHRLAGCYPDGQLFVGLHAHTPGLAVAEPAEVLYGLLVGTGMQMGQIPPGLEERARVWRDRMAGRRVLLVLDDAVGRGQIEPLLPGGPGCLVLITSRRPIDLDDAEPLPLDVLPPETAIGLFTRLTNQTFTDDEAGQVAELVGWCAGLPLAIALLAGRTRRHFRHRGTGLAEVMARLADADRLAQMAAGGRPGDRAVTIAFEMSYRDLPPPQQHLFRLLGLHPGPDIDTYAAAALTAAPLSQTRDHLDALRDEYLLQPLGGGRYQMHDLLRDYARTLVAQDPVTDSDTALDRLLDYYAHTLQVADWHLSRKRRSAAAPASPSLVTPDLHDRAEAMAWMRAERANLLACIDHTTTRRLHDRTITLTTALTSLLRHDGPWPVAITLHKHAVAAARHTNNHPALADALHNLGHSHYLTDDYPQASDLLERALALFRDLDDRLGEANTLNSLGRVRYLTDYAQASDLQEQALTLFRDLGDQLGEADTLNDLGRIRSATGDFVQASGLLSQALALFRDLGDQLGEAQALHELGLVRILTGDFIQASGLLSQALTLFRDLGDRLGETHALPELGRVRTLTGDFVQASSLLEQALSLSRDLGDRLGEAHALYELGRVRIATGDFVQASGLLEQALPLYRGLGAQHGEANTRHELGRVRTLTGEHHRASELVEQALVLFRKLGDQQGEAEVLCSLGELLARTANPDQARAVYQQALKLARQIGSPLDEAHALEGIARATARSGKKSAAVGPLREVVTIYERLGVPEARRAAAYLAELKFSPPDY